VVDKESEKELAQLREKVITLQSQLREKLSELDDVQFTSRRQDNQVRKSEERFDSERATLQDRIRSLEQENAKLSAKLSVRLNGSTSALADADSTPIDWKIRCQQMERELETLRRDIRGSGSKLAKYPDVHTKVLLGEVEVLKESSGTKSHKISELRDKQKEMHTEKIALKTEAVELQKEKAEASKQAATAARQATRLQEQVDTLQSRLEEASKDIKRLRKENDSLADERVSLVLAVKKAQIEVLAATGERLQVVLPSSVESEL
jgi:chromosome segregation ATPase